MTSSEIADWLEDHGKRHQPWSDKYAQAAATIRALVEALDLIQGYAEHDEGCGRMVFGSGDKCNCGLEKALTRIKALDSPSASKAP